MVKILMKISICLHSWRLKLESFCSRSAAMIVWPMTALFSWMRRQCWSSTAIFRFYSMKRFIYSLLHLELETFSFLFFFYKKSQKNFSSTVRLFHQFQVWWQKSHRIFEISVYRIFSLFLIDIATNPGRHLILWNIFTNNWVWVGSDIVMLFHFILHSSSTIETIRLDFYSFGKVW